MIAKAKAKLQAEMDAAKDNDYIQYIGESLLSHIDATPQDAEKIMVADKTIAKSLDDMRKAAEKKKKGNMAILTPREGIAVVFKYFGIEANPSIPLPAVVAPAVALAGPVSSGSDFSVSLEEFGL